MPALGLAAVSADSQQRRWIAGYDAMKARKTRKIWKEVAAGVAILALSLAIGAAIGLMFGG